jgi:phosphatidylserine/phosphatidylglycerophosphate/cardiolipin synthase-like enzyme
MLMDAARRGVSVVLMYDSWGSKKLRFEPDHLRRLTDAGVVVTEFNPITGVAKWGFNVLYRNHRKILVVVGFCGGMNIAAEYCGPHLVAMANFVILM